MSKVFVESITRPGLRFEVLGFDPETNRGKLVGEMGEVFERDLSKEALTKNGYKIVVDSDQPST